MESPELNHIQMSTLSLTKEAKIYNGENLVSSINGGAKSRQLCIEE